MAGYSMDDRTWLTRDFPGAPDSSLRTPPELQPITPAPTLTSLLLPSNVAVSNPTPRQQNPSKGAAGLVLGAMVFGWLIMAGGPKRNPQRNVAMGFWMGRGARRKFHPIRASHDYDSRRAGEGRKRRKVAKRRRR